MLTIFVSTIVGDSLKEAMMSCVKMCCKNEIFARHIFLKAINLSGGTLNLQVIELIRSVETKGIRFASLIFPSRASTELYSKHVEVVGDMICPYEM